MKFCALASGSAGNATFLSTKETRILIDDGLSVKDLRARMEAIDERIEDLDAVVLTHEHGDHWNGIPRLVTATMRSGRPVPVYTTDITAGVLKWGNIEMPPVTTFKAGATLSIGDICLKSFSVMHDAVDAIALCIEAEGKKIGFATDLGFVPPALGIRWRGADLVMIESNHDHDMLWRGDHPENVKERVSGERGHLSNADLFGYVTEHMDKTVSRIVLAHLSRECNSPRLAYENAKGAIEYRGLDSKIIVASQAEVTEVIEF